MCVRVLMDDPGFQGFTSDDFKYLLIKRTEVKMKPFDLEAALRGEKVVTRDGREVKEITLFKHAHPSHCVAGIISGHIHIYDKSGNAHTNMFATMQHNE